jgi:MATE family multidrug resistance protein
MTTFLSIKDWPNEARTLGRLASPLIVNNLSIAGMHFADAVMAGRLGAEALAAVAVGGSIWFLGFTVCLGLMMAISPITARRYGAGELSAIGRYTRQGLWLAIVLGLTLITLVHLLAEPVLIFIGIDEGFREMTVGYVQAIIYGAPAISGFLAFRFTTEGIGFMRPIMYTSLFGLVCNVFLNYVFIYGHFGVPAFGAVGCGMASAITMWLIMFMLGTIMYLEDIRACFTAARADSQGNRKAGNADRHYHYGRSGPVFRSVHPGRDTWRRYHGSPSDCA